MDYNTFNALARFRHGLYRCFQRAGDALMNLNDALLCDVSARSFVELSLSPFFVRRWPSLYEGLQDATIDRAALQELFAAQVLPPASGQRLVLGVDASSIARPQSPTARDRTYVHASNLPQGSKPIVAGWQYSTLCVLPQTPSSWTYVLDNQRIPSQETQGRVKKPRGRWPQSSSKASCRCYQHARRRCALFSWPMATMVARPFYGRRRSWPATNCCASPRTVSCTGPRTVSCTGLHRLRPASEAHPGKTERAERRSALCLRPASNTRLPRPAVERDGSGQAALGGRLLAEPALQGGPRRDGLGAAGHAAPGRREQAGPAPQRDPHLSGTRTSAGPAPQRDPHLSGTRTSVGLCSAAKSCRRSLRSRLFTGGVTAWNTATGWTNRTCCGRPRDCGPRKPLSTGRTW